MGNEKITFDTLSDVDIQLCVEYGSRFLTFKDIQALQEEDIIEFNEGVEAPLNVYLENEIIAEGVLKRFKGHYCLQVTKIFQKEDSSLYTEE